jgi:hypothetical protein
VPNRDGALVQRRELAAPAACAKSRRCLRFDAHFDAAAWRVHRV